VGDGAAMKLSLFALRWRDELSMRACTYTHDYLSSRALIIETRHANASPRSRFFLIGYAIFSRLGIAGKSV
jgi:hypothetical protein